MTGIKLDLPGWSIPKTTSEARVRKYSTTGDILAFKRCRRQYGYFSVRGFVSATNTQQYFGILVHDVLDRINRDYHLGSPLPDEAGIEALIEAAHERLVLAGIRPYNATTQRAQATKLISRFVQMVGPHFFPHVQETEYRLERPLCTPQGRDYLLTGVVDVLSGAVSHALRLAFSTMPDDVEIWDYKSGRKPEQGSHELLDYEYQMRVYCELYRQQSGEYPARAMLVFVGELGDDSAWQRANLRADEFPKLFFPVHPTLRHITGAMNDFHATVEAIEGERAKPYSQQWDAPPPSADVDQSTCEACELRYNCDYFVTKDRRRALRELAQPL